jgi:hypothetical protein
VGADLALALTWRALCSHLRSWQGQESFSGVFWEGVVGVFVVDLCGGGVADTGRGGGGHGCGADTVAQVRGCCLGRRCHTCAGVARAQPTWELCEVHLQD